MNNIHETTVVAPLNRAKNANRLGELRTPGLLGQQPLLGLLMLVAGGLAYGAIVAGMQPNSGLLIQLDAPVNNAFHTVALQSSPLLRNVMIFGFYVGEHFIAIIGLLLALYFLHERFWPEFSMVAIAWAGEGGIWLVLSQYYNRPRPVFDVIVWHQMASPSFPSGHAFSAVMCYGLLAYLLAPRLTSRFWKIAVWAMAILIMVYIGVSRLFVGDHYLTDVLAGYALGIAWSGLVYTAVEVVAKKRIIRHVQKT